MKTREIETCRFYVNDSRGLVREVTAVQDDGQVEYFSYWLEDGVCDGVLGVCHRRTLAAWASREATEDEVGKLKTADARKRSEDFQRRMLAEAVAKQSNEDPFEPSFPGGFTLRDEANALVAWAFRNGPLEDLHAGKSSPLVDDPTLSRITDDEMKTLMLSACRQLAELLELKASNPADYERQIKSYGFRYCRKWER